MFKCLHCLVFLQNQKPVMLLLPHAPACTVTWMSNTLSVLQRKKPKTEPTAADLVGLLQQALTGGDSAGEL